MAHAVVLTEADYPAASENLARIAPRYEKLDPQALNWGDTDWSDLHALRVKSLDDVSGAMLKRGVAGTVVSKQRRLLTLAMLEYELTHMLPLHMKGWLEGFESGAAGGAYAALFAPWHDHLDPASATSADLAAVHDDLWHHFPGYATWRKLGHDAASGIEDVILGEELAIYQSSFPDARAQVATKEAYKDDKSNNRTEAANVLGERKMTDDTSRGSGWIAAFIVWNVLALFMAVPVAVAAAYLQINGYIGDDVAGAMIYILSPLLAAGLMLSVRQASGMSFVDWLVSLPWLNGPTRRWLGVAVVAALSLLIYAGFASFNGTRLARVEVEASGNVAIERDADVSLDNYGTGNGEAAPTDNAKRFEKEGATWLGLD